MLSSSRLFSPSASGLNRPHTAGGDPLPIEYLVLLYSCIPVSVLVFLVTTVRTPWPSRALYHPPAAPSWVCPTSPFPNPPKFSSLLAVITVLNGYSPGSAGPLEVLSDRGSNPGRPTTWTCPLATRATRTPFDRWPAFLQAPSHS